MKRRRFLEALSLASASALAEEGPPPVYPVEKMTAGSAASIGLSHVGFHPSARKRIVVRRPVAPPSFVLRDIASGPRFQQELPLQTVASDFGPLTAGDFSAVTREGLYQIRVGEELSPPFFIRRDAWRRLLPTVTTYHRAQRCGVAVPNVHPACHLDDARRRDNGEHIDTTGGWHDAGDVRKWMDATMMNAFGLLALGRHLGAGWDLAGSGLAPLEEELRWGNRYFLKMQDSLGRVWNDVAGGVNGDNSDNHWTDNKIGTSDDRYLNPAVDGLNQAMFTTMQAMYARAFHESDPAYAAICLRAANKCWEANSHRGDTTELSWWLLAAIELQQAAEVRQIAGILAHLQQPGGFWQTSPANPEPYKHAVHGALPAFAVLEAARAFHNTPHGSACRTAARRYIENYIVPLCERSAYGIVPFGVFTGSPTPERYRHFKGDLTYRFFMPVRKQFWWAGLNAHLGSHALLLAAAAQEFNQPAWRDLAVRQFEWIFGNNPFGASLVSGIGERNPYPHSRYVGVIPGGIMCGIGGNTDDEPVLDTGFSGTWRTNEYWSPPVGYFEWAQAILESS